MNRRKFLSSVPAISGALSSSSMTGGQPAYGGFCLVGRWMIDSGELHFKDDSTGFFRALHHDGPQIKFPTGIPQRGDAVKVHVAFDTCYARGENKHRRVTKLVLRVKPISDLRDRDAEIRLIHSPLKCEEVEQLFSALRPVRLWVRTTFGDAWLIKVTRETEALARQIDMPLMPPETPTWKTAEDK